MYSVPGRQAVDEHRSAKAPEPSADVDVEAEQVADDRAAKHGVRQTVANIAHLAQHDVDSDQATQTPDQECRYQTAHEKAILQRLSDERHQFPPVGDAPG